MLKFSYPWGRTVDQRSSRTRRREATGNETPNSIPDTSRAESKGTL